MRNRKSPLPKKNKKAPPITLALDLDETLVHCRFGWGAFASACLHFVCLRSVQHMDRAELTFDVNFNGVDYQVPANLTPNLSSLQLRR
jgi:hypothetical protein